MHYKITIESSETGLVSISATVKDMAFINCVEAYGRVGKRMKGGI